MKALAPLLFAVVLGCGSTPKPTPAAPVEQSDPLASACEAGTATSCLIAADALERKGAPAEAGRLYQRGCELGEVTGCALAGGAYADAEMLSESSAAFELGCAKGDATACYGAGLAYLGTFGGAEDAAAARRSFQSSCDLGLSSACGELAGLLAAGKGGEVDSDGAAKLWAQACDAGDGASCTRLGLMSWGEKDPKAGLPYFEKACLAEVIDFDGCAYLGWFLWSAPDGDEQMRGIATMDAACKSGSAMGCALRARVHAKNGEVAEGRERLARACDLAPAMCEKMSASFEAEQKP